MAWWLEGATRQKQFFAYFWSQEKNQKKKSQEKSIFIDKNRFFSGENRFLSEKNQFLSEKSAIFRRFFFFRFFHPNIFSSTTEIRFFSEKSAEIDYFFVHGWEEHLPLVEFAYNNSYQASIQMAPYEALYGSPC